MSGRLAGKVALITGAAGGQGAAEAALFVAQGAKVMLTDRDAPTALADSCGENAAHLPLDVANEADWRNAVDQTVRRFGKLDVLINNAGIFALGGIEATSPERFMEFVRVNQLGVFLGMRAVIPAMRVAGGGSIVNISSLHGLTGCPQSIAYSSTKWAIRGMTKVAALELAPLKIRVNSVHPGAVKTGMALDCAPPDDKLPYHMPIIPQERWAEAAEVAEMVAFVASDACSYTTGSEFIIDGGIMAF